MLYFLSYQLFNIIYIIIGKRFKTATRCISHTIQSDNLRIIAKGLNTPAMNEEIARTSTLML